MRVCWRKIRGQRNSMACLYAACERAGYNLDFVNGPENDITLYSLNSITGPSLFQEIRSADVITIVGGPHACARWDELTSIADYVVVGEGEFTLPRLLRCIEDDLPLPPGVATSTSFQAADHSVLLDGNPSFSEHKGYIEISRGCPFGCTYCQTPRIFGNKIRHRSIDSIVKLAQSFHDIRFLSPNALAYGTDGIHPEIRHMQALLRELAKMPDKDIFLGTFPGEIRPEFVSEEAVDLIARYCSNTKVHIGAQSGADSTLKKIRRGHTLSDVWNAVDHCVDAGFIPVIDIIVGFPDETDDELLKTVSFCREVSGIGYVHAHRFFSLPGTPLEGRGSRDLIPEVESALGSLALSGRLTGSWNNPEIRFFSKVPK
ncbi:MAG: TIGR04013 family B12-binding domain/radical SAM domain-containing protein [Methanomicrobiales archaeon]|nr:TIGR04013 family B12-binding domain/radical SAM domain-containing protein [Methanomicrobiales archaeon]